MLDTCPSSRQVEITYDDQRVIVVEVGGGIRCHEAGGRSAFHAFSGLRRWTSPSLPRLGPAQSVSTARGARLT